MQHAVRSYLSAGVAIAGAGVVAVSPIAPTLPAIEAATHAPSAVELSALVNPFAEYAVAFDVAFQNISALAERIAQNPTPILSQIVENQLRSAAGISKFVNAFGESVVSQVVLIPGQLQVAAGQLAAGNVSTALMTAFQATLAPIVQAVVDTLLFNPDIYIGLQEAIRQPFANLLNVIDLVSYPNVLNVLGPLLAPVQLLTDVVTAVGAAGDGIVSGFRNADLEEVANALLSLGPNLTYAVLNGTPDYSAGLLGANGIIAGLLSIRDMIADAITPKPTVTAAVAEAPSTATRSFTLDVTPAAVGTTDESGPTADAGTPAADAGTDDQSGGSALPAAGDDGTATADPADDTADVPPVSEDDGSEEGTTPPAEDDSTDTDVSVDDPATDDDSESTAGDTTTPAATAGDDDNDTGASDPAGSDGTSASGGTGASGGTSAGGTASGGGATDGADA